jgi:transposase InsO family protein
MPMPLIHEVLDRLQGARYFTTLDVAWGYWHIEMDPDSIDKTAFVTNEGHYEWLVLPFGLKNAPATFQRIIQQILGPLLYRGAINYLDDFIIYSETFDEHMRLLDDVLQRLSDHNIKLKMSKCHFAKKEVTYLGHVVSYNTVKPSPAKIEAVQRFPVPNTLRKVREFLGLTGYYRRFIEHFTHISKPLTSLTRKGVPFNWGSNQQTVFATLVDAITKPPTLALYDSTKPCILYTDASKIGIGATLAQKDDNGVEHVIEYFSKRLQPSQENYTASELECLAIVEAIEHFEVYLDKRFTVITDHMALKWLLSFKKPKGRLFHWSIKLSTYSFDVIHRAGRNQQHVDALSRSPISCHLTPEELTEAQKQSDMSYVKDPKLRQNVITIKQRNLYKAVVPKQLRPKLLDLFHEQHSHPGKTKTVKLITTYYWWPNIIHDIKQHVSSCRTCQLTKHSHKPTPGQYVIPESSLEPGDLVGLDTIVMGPSANKTRHKYIQVFIDHHSRYIWAFPTATNTSAAIVTLLTNLVKSGVKIKHILTDCHKNFTSKTIKDFFHRNHIKHTLSTPYHPQTNGIVERANGTIICKLRAALLDKPHRKWSTLLSDVVHNYNNTPHDITGFTPQYLFFGIDTTPPFGSPTTSLEEARELARQRTKTAQQRRKQLHDAKHESILFEPGDRVVRSIPSTHPSQTKTSQRWSDPYFIIKRLSDVTYDISETLSGPTIRAHISQLKKFIARQQTQQPGENVTNVTEPMSPSAGEQPITRPTSTPLK